MNHTIISRLQKCSQKCSLFLLCLFLYLFVVGCQSQPSREPAAATRAPDIGQVTCYQSSSIANGLRYCVTKPISDSKSRAVIYYLHGNGGSEADWDMPDHRTIQELWRKNRVESPTIVSVSFGATWFLSQEDGLFTDSLFDTLVKQAIPEIEAKLKFKISERVLMGESMGGFNAALLYLKAKELFKRVAVVCPAILSFAPQAPQQEIEAYLKRHAAYVNRKLVEKWRDKLLKVYSNPDLWREHNPLELAQQVDSSWPALYLHNGERDIFGFNEGTERFADALKGKRAQVEWHSVKDGAHCQQTPATLESLARFLVP